MKILLPLHGFVNWNGGVDLLRLIIEALNSIAPKHNVSVVFAFPVASLQERFLQRLLRFWRTLRAAAHSPAGDPAQLLRAAAHLIEGRDVIQCGTGARSIGDAASDVGADVVFPCMLAPVDHRTCWIGYLFDFQHKYLPHFFSARTRANRDKRFANIAMCSDALVVNSRAVAGDVEKFLGIDRARILAMPFTPFVQSWWFGEDPVVVARKYGVRGRYFLVCNHFWLHKDHATALRAYALFMHGRTDNIELLLTGDPVDYRFPALNQQLIDLARELKISDRVRFLGLIPKKDQLALLRGCLALVQPTRFEGGPGGGAVYEAIGLGVPAIVSDIEINREIDSPLVTFFTTGDAHALADALSQQVERERADVSPEKLLDQSRSRLAQLGNQIINFIEQQLSKRR